MDDHIWSSLHAEAANIYISVSCYEIHLNSIQVHMPLSNPILVILARDLILALVPLFKGAKLISAHSICVNIPQCLACTTTHFYYQHTKNTITISFPQQAECLLNILLSLVTELKKTVEGAVTYSPRFKRRVNAEFGIFNKCNKRALQLPPLAAFAGMMDRLSSHNPSFHWTRILFRN